MDNVTSIGNFAFYDCASLKSIDIPDTVTSIGDGAFEGCSSLERMTIPDTVTSIGKLAFCYCPELTDIFYSGTQEQWRKAKTDESKDDKSKKPHQKTVVHCCDADIEIRYGS